MLYWYKLNLLTYLKQDWINFGATSNYFIITMPKFTEPEVEVKLTSNYINVFSKISEY